MDHPYAHQLSANIHYRYSTHHSFEFFASIDLFDGQFQTSIKLRKPVMWKRVKELSPLDKKWIIDIQSMMIDSRLLEAVPSLPIYCKDGVYLAYPSSCCPSSPLFALVFCQGWTHGPHVGCEGGPR